jgi:hypothetical protein
MRMRSLVLAILLSSSVALAAPPSATPPSSPGSGPPSTTPTIEPGQESPAQSAPAPAPIATAPVLVRLEADTIPESCATLAKAADSPSMNRALSARISLANCIADITLKTLVPCDCAQSIQEIDSATELSRLLFDEAIAMGDATTQILARHAKGELLANLVTRMIATIPPPPNATPEAVALRDSRMDLLLPLLAPWLAAAQAEDRELDKVARANPQLAKNPAVANAIRASRARLAGTVAKR